MNPPLRSPEAGPLRTAFELVLAAAALLHVFAAWLVRAVQNASPLPRAA